MGKGERGSSGPRTPLNEKGGDGADLLGKKDVLSTLNDDLKLDKNFVLGGLFENTLVSNNT